MAHQEDEGDRSLSAMFKQSKSLQEDLDMLDPRSEDFKSNLASAILSLQKCAELVNGLALFSKNEDLEDISTSSIQFLGIDYLLAELTLRAYSSTDRKDQLSKSSEYLGRFLIRLDEYDSLSVSDKKLLEVYRESPTTFRIVPETAGMESKRNTKIKRFQAEKELKTRLKLLRDQSQSLNVDDEIIRNLYLAELNLYVHQAFASLDLITQEREMLKMMPQQPDPTKEVVSQTDGRDRRNGTGISQAYSDRLDPQDLLAKGKSQRGILDSAGRPLQPFTITSKRTDVKKGVFQPGHRLPTMSIDEYLEEERKRGGIIEGGGPQSEVQQEADEDDERQQDAATVKAREWDEYVEANPKGWGNTLNRG